MKLLSILRDSDSKISEILKWMLVVILPMGIYLLLDAASLTHILCVYASITLWAILSWMTGVLPDTIVSLLLPVFYILAGVAKPIVVFSPWYGTVPWITLGGFLIGAMLTKTGLGLRIAYTLIRLAGGSYRNCIFGLMLTGFLIGPIVPSVLSKMTIMCIIACSICQALHLQPGSNEAAGILLGAFFGVSIPAMCFLTGSAHIPMAVGIMEQVAGITVTWSRFSMHNLPVCLLYAAVVYVAICLLFKQKSDLDMKTVINTKYQKLGNTSAQEKKGIVVLLVTVAFLATDSLHHISAGWIMMIAALTLFLPGIDILRQEDLKTLNVLLVFYIVGAMSIGAVAINIGADKLLADGLITLLEGVSTGKAIGLSYLFGMAALIFLMPITALSALTGALTTAAMQLGVNSQAMLYSFMYGLDQAIFPYQFATMLIIYKTGLISIKQLVRILVPKTVICFLIIIYIAYPFWSLLGLT